MLRLVTHPLIEHKMAWLRKKETDKKMFRELLGEVSVLLFYEATRDLPLISATVETPLAPARCRLLPDTAIALVPVLRAGLGMVDALQNIAPIAKVGHLGLYRDEMRLEPVEYYRKLPHDIAERHVFILDPMLATGGSLSTAITLLKQHKPPLIRVISIIATPEGVRRIERDHPEVDVYTAALDEGLNEKGYIVPGLGDAGDRLFGTR